MILPTPDQQQARLLECLADPTCKVTYWNSDQHGAPANHACENYGAQWRAYPGRMDDIGGTPRACSDRGLHGTDLPHQWKGCRVWIVALWNWTQDGNKYAATKREIICEVAPESVVDPAVAARMNLSQANLSGANLSGAYLSQAYLSQANLSGANLSGAYLSQANLSGANLSGANLSQADLSQADLSGANLSGANLSGANLSQADLSQADLSQANLSGANLSGAYLSRAYLSRANLSGAYGKSKAQRIDFAARGALFADVETE